MALQLAFDLMDLAREETDERHGRRPPHLALMEAPLDLTDGPLELPDTHGLTVAESKPGLDANAEDPYLEIIVPALNEEVRLGASLQHIAEYLARQPYTGVITVVDNGSVDRTADLIIEDVDAHVPIRLIGCAQRGKGAAVRRGILTQQGTVRRLLRRRSLHPDRDPRRRPARPSSRATQW